MAYGLGPPPRALGKPVDKASIWAIYNDLSRRLVTPNGGEK